MTTPISAITPLPSPIKGDADWRSYRCFKLPNGVTVSLVHDKESKTTAAAALVNVGAGSDPRSLSGLAHFCEHMCFLGSERYPGENEYKHFLSTHGGRSNASTSLHVTNYKFEVLSEHAEKALDIFSQFFVAPLFTQSGTSREVHAVDSENSKNLISDVRRRLQILKALGDENHYYTKFTTGNSKTLPTEDESQITYIRQALLDFHSYHYRPEKLFVVVAGPQSLDQLQEWIVPRFGAMMARPFPSNVKKMNDTQRLVHRAAKDAPPYGFEEPQAAFQSAYHADSTWPFLVSIKPIKSTRQLVITWPLPPVGKNLDQSPVSALSHLVGHEGPQSAFAVLQEEGLLSSLSAGPRHSGPDFTLFQVNVGLTERGEEEWKHVVDIIMQYCRMIHNACRDAKTGKSSDLQRIWNESAQLSAMFFHQSSPGNVYDFAPGLASRIITDGTEKCLSAGCMLSETAESFPLDRVTDFVSRLVPSNCFLERCSLKAWEEMEELEKTGATAVNRKVEPWYGIEYFVSGVDKSDVKRWDGAESPFLDAANRLALPRPNRFIPRSLELCEDLPPEAKAGPRIEKEIEPPRLLVDDQKMGRLWHRLDDRYALPKSVLTFLIRTASVEHVHVNHKWQPSVEASMHSSILGGIFSEAMAVDTYDAQLAGLHWNLALTSSGIKISCSGFSDRLPDLALKILQAFLVDDFLTDAYFLSTKDRVTRNLKTYFESRRADSNAMYYRDFLLTSRSEGVDAALVAVDVATVESVKEHHKSIMNNPEWIVDCLFTGNVSEKDGKAFFAAASELMSEAFAPSTRLSGQAMWYPGEIERRIPAGNDIEFHFSSKNDSDENGSVIVTYQSAIPGYRGEVLSTPESLKSSASIRLISHILREPLFDELRTKQTLGYVVSSWFDVGVSSRPPNGLVPQTVPVDFLVISVLSRKLSPVEVATRIDDFLMTFRQMLVDMPVSELESYATGLSTKMRKPIQKLSEESSTHFAKLKYAPEIFGKQLSSEHVPWDNSKALARQVEELEQKDLLETWDRLVLPKNRARLTAHVYGKTFPLEPNRIKRQFSKRLVVDSLPSVLDLRSKLPVFDNTITPPARFALHRVMEQMTLNKTLFGVATVAAIGVGWTIISRSRKMTK